MSKMPAGPSLISLLVVTVETDAKPAIYMLPMLVGSGTRQRPSMVCVASEPRLAHHAKV